MTPPDTTLRAGQPAGSSPIVAALLAFRASRIPAHRAGPHPFTHVPAVDALLSEDPFAFLIGVIFDHGIPASRAWAAPYALRQRLGHLDPARMAADPAAVFAAVDTPPKLHRFVPDVSGWAAGAAARVMDEFGGDAGAIWADMPTAAELRRRLRAFKGIGPKKANMAVEILERDLGVPVAALEGTAIAYNRHVRRVFLRTGLAGWDDDAHAMDAAHAAHPERPSALDYPAWAVGHGWCHPTDPICPACPLVTVCPKEITRADA
jgi:uncharacterized HhH-GPD family protein